MSHDDLLALAESYSPALAAAIATNGLQAVADRYGVPMTGLETRHGLSGLLFALARAIG